MNVLLNQGLKQSQFLNSEFCPILEQSLMDSGIKEHFNFFHLCHNILNLEDEMLLTFFMFLMQNVFYYGTPELITILILAAEIIVEFVCWHQKKKKILFQDRCRQPNHKTSYDHEYIFTTIPLSCWELCACLCLGCIFSLSVSCSINLVAPLIWHHQVWKHISDRSQSWKFNIPLCPQSSASSSLDPWRGRVPLHFWSRSRVSPSGGRVSPPSCLCRIMYSGWGPRVVEEAWNVPSFLPHRGLAGRVGAAPGS